jgi:hypothetical protein
MPSTITLEARIMGQRKPLVADEALVLPDFDPPTLRTLITQVVLEQVNAFRKRQAESRLVHVLTARQMDDAAARGKVASGGSDVRQVVDPQEAVEVALLAFADGLFLVFIDGEPVASLDAEVHLAEEARVSFVRLVALAGG